MIDRLELVGHSRDDCHDCPFSVECPSEKALAKPDHL